MQHEIKKKLKKLFYFDQILFYDFLLCAESRKPSISNKDIDFYQLFKQKCLIILNHIFSQYVIFFIHHKITFDEKMYTYI